LFKTKKTAFLKLVRIDKIQIMTELSLKKKAPLRIPPVKDANLNSINWKLLSSVVRYNIMAGKNRGLFFPAISQNSYEKFIVKVFLSYHFPSSSLGNGCISFFYNNEY
jgi:hypothetical protein